MKLKEILPDIINTIINFYITYNHIIHDDEVIIKHPELLYNDMYNRIYNEYVNTFNNDDVYTYHILNSINPYYRTYNKLSSDNNILETLVTYINDYLIYFNILISPLNVIIGFDSEVPFENGLDINFNWIKMIIDIYR